MDRRRGFPAAGYGTGDTRWKRAAHSLDTTAVILTSLPLAFVTRLGVPARPYLCACAFVVKCALFRWLFWGQLAESFDPPTLPEPVVPHRRFFQGAVVIFVLVLLGYFTAQFVPLPPYAAGFQYRHEYRAEPDSFRLLGTMLVLTTARKQGENIRGMNYFRVGIYRHAADRASRAAHMFPGI